MSDLRPDSSGRAGVSGLGKSLAAGARLPFSVLVPTLNEVDNLRACLDSVACAAEVVVVDSGSTDGTPELARELGARVVTFHWNGQFPRKKNWALANVDWAHDWVFVLDADERLSPELAAELQQVLAAPQHAGYYVNRRFWFLDGWLRHCGYYPSWNLRFFRHRLGRYENSVGVVDPASGDNEVHEHVELQGSAGRLRGEIDHFAFPTISAWVEKHNRYSSWEARQCLSPLVSPADNGARLAPELARKRQLKNIARHLPCRPLLRFLYHYVWRRGFLDGRRGYVFCRLMGIYEFLSVAKANELRRAPRSASTPPHGPAAVS